MSVDNPKFGKGITLAGGFDLGAKAPLDSRDTVATIEERDLHVTGNRAYVGMLVFVEENQMTYQYVVVGQDEEGNDILGWKEFGFNQNDFDDAFSGSIEEVEGRLDAIEEDIARIDGADDVEGSIKKQIKDAVEAEAGLREAADNALDERVKAIEEDLAQGGETEARIAQNEADIDALQGLVGKPAEGEEAASGLHLALDNAKNELNQAINNEKGRAEGQEAAIRQELADEAAEIRGEMAEQHQAMDKALEDEAAEIRQELADAIAQEVKDRDAAIEVEKGRAEGQEAAIRQELADEAAEIRQELANEKAALQAEIDADVKVVADELAKQKDAAQEGTLAHQIAQEVANREQAVQDLADRHDEEMDAAEGRIADLEELVGKPAEGEAAASGLHLALDNAKNELNQAINNEKDRAEGQEAAIRQELANEKAALQAEIDADVKVVQDELDKQKDAEQEGTLANQIKVENERAVAKEGELAQAIADEAARADAAEKANKAVIDKLDGAVDVEGSVKKQIKDAVDAVNADAEALEARVKVNEDALAGLEKETVQASIDQAEADAKKYADDAITALVDSAPDAMNTLNELAKAINDNKGVYDAYVEEHNQAMAALKEELQGEIDADVKVVADELAKQKDAEQEGTLANQIKVEKGRAEGQEAAIRQELADAIAKEVEDRNAAIEVEKGRAEGQEAAIRQELADEAAEIRGEMAEQHQAMDKALEDEAAAIRGEMAEQHQAMDKALEDEAAAIRGELADAIAQEVEDRNAAIEVEKGRAEGQEAAIRQELADEAAEIRGEVEAIVGKHAVEADPENGVEAVVGSGLRKEMDDAVAAEKVRAEGQEAAIRQEFANADVALHATIKNEMAAVIQSLSASITEDGMLRVALGGIEGDEVLVIREQQIPIITNDEIDAIIASLDEEDEPAGE